MKIACPKTPKCPLFNGHLLKRKGSAETYRLLYCNSEIKFKQCVRYIISEKTGKCADFIMPNSSLTIDEIMNRMKIEGIL